MDRIGGWWWSVRAASARARLLVAAVAVVALLVALAVMSLVSISSSPPQVHTTAAPAASSDPARGVQAPELGQDPVVALGERSEVKALDQPKCRQGLARVTKLASGRTIDEVSDAVRQEVGFNATLVGRFCTPKQAATLNTSVLQPFYG